MEKSTSFCSSSTRPVTRTESLSSCSCSGSDHHACQDDSQSVSSATSSSTYTESYSSGCEEDCHSRSSCLSDGLHGDGIVESDVSLDWIAESVDKTTGHLFYLKVLPNDSEGNTSLPSTTSNDQINPVRQTTSTDRTSSPSKRIKDKKSNKSVNSSRGPSLQKVDGYVNGLWRIR